MNIFWMVDALSPYCSTLLHLQYCSAAAIALHLWIWNMLLIVVQQTTYSGANHDILWMYLKREPDIGEKYLRLPAISALVCSSSRCLAIRIRQLAAYCEKINKHWKRESACRPVISGLSLNACHSQTNLGCLLDESPPVPAAHLMRVPLSRPTLTANIQNRSKSPRRPRQEIACEMSSQICKKTKLNHPQVLKMIVQDPDWDQISIIDQYQPDGPF